MDFIKRYENLELMLLKIFVGIRVFRPDPDPNLSKYPDPDPKHCKNYYYTRWVVDSVLYFVYLLS